MSELHNRLAHLVNYSSQLIFVSGDTVADQQRTLSDFLSAQEENTEISFITAESNKPANDYRAAICRQLGGHTVGSFVRPLNQLLADLTPDAGPYLVCVTGADKLDRTFLQELWDWVMQSQQAEHKIHLNIILFGKSDWAESSQEWLPSQNSNKPVLLSSHSVNSSGFDVNALEALMANERSWLNLSSGPIVTNKWFIGSVLSLFFVIFIGLLSWQYPEQINQLISGGDIEETTLPAFNIQESASPEQIFVADKIENDAVIASTENQYTSQFEIIENKTIDTIEKNEDEQSVTENLLVRSWQTDKPTQKEDANLSQQNNSVTVIKNDIVQIPVEGDFQVPDIISIEQLDEQLGNNLDSASDSEIYANSETKEANSDITNSTIKSELIDEINSGLPNNPASDAAITNNEPLNTIDSEYSIDYRFDETTLLSLPTDSILLQLSGIQNPVVLENYLATNNLKTSTWVYETQRYGGPWYVVLYRQSFDSIDAALSRMSSLPEDLKNAGPFAKSVNQIQQEIRRR